MPDDQSVEFHDSTDSTDSSGPISRPKSASSASSSGSASPAKRQSDEDPAVVAERRARNRAERANRRKIINAVVEIGESPVEVRSVLVALLGVSDTIDVQTMKGIGELAFCALSADRRHRLTVARRVLDIDPTDELRLGIELMEMGLEAMKSIMELLEHAGVAVASASSLPKVASKAAIQVAEAIGAVEPDQLDLIHRAVQLV